ncbi:MAG: hAT transposon family protein [Ketobacter sp.]|nr:hAT transposon family protein [Ketobacter sp.]
MNYLAIPATSASVERLFSIAGISLSGRRMKIGAELLGNETLLKYNKKFLRNDYIF